MKYRTQLKTKNHCEHTDRIKSLARQLRKVAINLLVECHRHELRSIENICIRPYRTDSENKTQHGCGKYIFRKKKIGTAK